MRILFTADWHLDIQNLAYTVPAIAAGIEAIDESHDLFIHGGDLVVNRSSVHPHVAHQVRRLIERASACPLGGIVIAGNHDQSFQPDRAGMVEGILGGTSFANIEIASTITTTTRTKDYGSGASETVGFVLVPTPNKYHARAVAQGGADLVHEMTIAIQAEIADLRERGDIASIVVVYHGCVAGAMLSDEVQMPSGVDLSLPISAFAGADIVLAGHIHKGQTLQSGGGLPRVVYCGSPAPLNWGEAKASPRMVVVDCQSDLYNVSLLDLPVVSQMIDLSIDVPETEQGAALQAAVEAAAPGEGDRLRLRLRGTGAALDGVRADLAASLCEAYGLLSCKAVPERTDSAAARADVGMADAIDSALTKWLFQRGIESGDARHDAVCAMSREVESVVTDRHLDARYEMIPRWLQVKNWCQYAEAELSFSDVQGLTVIEGPNYSGKSNLSRAMLFALYKWQVHGARLVDLIRKGEDAAVVTFDFSAHGRDYRVIRDLKRTSSGATASLHLLDMTGGVAESLAEGTARETQAAIEKIVGPLDLFLATCFAGQNEVDALLDLTPSDLKDLMTRLLQRDFAARHAYGRERLVEVSEKAGSLRHKESTLRGLVDDSADVDIARVGEWRYGLALSADQAREGFAAAVAAEAEARALVEAEDGLALAASAAKRRTEDALRRAEMARERVQCLWDSVREQMGRPRPAPPEQSSSDLAAALKIVREDTAAGATSEAYARKAVHDVRDAARAGAEILARDTADNEASHRRLSEAIARANEAEALVESVPCRGRVLGCGDDTVDCGECSLIALARRQSAQMADLVKERDRASVKREVLRSQTERSLLEVDQTSRAVARFEARIAEKRQDDALKSGLLQVEIDTAAAMERAVAVWQGTQEAAAADAAKISAEEDAALFARLDYESLLSESVDVGLQLEQCATHRQRLTESEIASAASRAGMARAAHDLSECDRQLAEASAKQSASKRAREEADLVAADISSAEAERAVANLYSQAMHRDGIPFLMLESFAIPVLQGVANEHLAGTGFSVEVEAERELQSGEMRNAVEISFSDHRGRHPISAASGAQRTAIGAALRHAMAEILARGTGSTIYLAVQDEGFGTLDPENLEIAKRTLRNIAERRGTFLVISHVPGMNDVADHVLRVIDDGGVSRVEVL